MNIKKPLAIGLGCAAGAYLGLSCLVQHEVFERNARLPAIINESSKKKDKGAPKRQDERSEWMHKQEFTEFRIESSKGDTLCGHYLEAAEKSNIFVLCSHGYRNRGKGEFRFISKFYHENGYNILLVDHTASGESGGRNITFGHQESADLLLWVEFLKKQFGEDIEIILHGISMGAASVLLLSGNFKLPENVKFAIADCSFSSVTEQFRSVLKSAHVPPQPLFPTVSLINRIRHGFSLSSVSPIEAVKNIKIPVLFVHGKNDGFVPTHMTEEMYALFSGKKDILLVEKAGHAQSYQKASEAYETKIKEFTSKYTGKTV